MAYLEEELRRAADAAIAAMQQAARRARDTHALAELMRHMTMTARNAGDRPRDAAARWMVDHWLEAWKLDRAGCPYVDAMTALSTAFHDHVRSPDDGSDRAIRAALEALERAYRAAGTNVADEMAWRSSCAHGWWAEVCPPPPGRAGADRRPPERPFWDHACPPHCL
jgi:hypothetical protein